MKFSPAILLVAGGALSFSAYALTSADMIGQSSTETPMQTVVVDSGTRHINVQQHEIVKITDGKDSVTWQFDGLNAVIPLSQILPASPDAADIKVYVQIDHPG